MSRHPFLAGLAAALLLTACGPLQGDDDDDDGGSSTAPLGVGGPIDGLSEDQIAAFERGREVFLRRFKPSEGLGPLYNATSCKSCHAVPTVGGSAELYRNFFVAAVGPPGFQINLNGLPGRPVPAFGTGVHATATFSLTGPRMDLGLTFFGLPVSFGQRNAPPVFGTGLFETISDETIIALSDPDDLDGDGISGRFNRDNGAIGRLGYKAQSNNVEAFTRGPLFGQLGITTNPFLGGDGIVSLGRAGFQISANPHDPLTDNDGITDPEMSTDDLGDLIAFSRFLAPPEPLPFTAEATAGQLLFNDIGCAKCHIPSLPGSDGPVNAYTDLLLHDMGVALRDNVAFGAPQLSSISPAHAAHEFRTQPLWGLRMHAPFLHDGRAETIEEAILAHGGEALDIRVAYENLSEADRAAVIAFLESL